MSLFTSINVSGGKYIDTVSDLISLRAYRPRRLEDADAVLVTGAEAIGDQSGGVYVWVENASKPDDNDNVIRPAHVVGLGRWIKIFGQGDAGQPGQPSTVPGPAGSKGDPGGNTLSTGLFTQLPNMQIPNGTDLIQTSGYGSCGVGAARYAYDASVNAAYVAANPTTAVITQNGRGFRLAEQNVEAAMIGVVPGSQTDSAISINAALSLPTTTAVVLPTGVTWIEQTIVVPADKELRGSCDSIVRALTTFKFVNGRNHVILLAGSRARAINLTADMNKVGINEGGSKRCNGVTVLNGARDCLRSNLTIMNCTGYGAYDSGADNHLAMPSSANYNVNTFNCQVHFEQQASDGSAYFNCHARDGDGDIACLSMWHPVAGPRNMLFVGCTGIGATPTIWEVTANITPIDNMQIIGGHFEQTNSGAVCFAVTAGITNRVTNLRISGARFIAPQGIGLNLSVTQAVLSTCEIEAAYPLEMLQSDVISEGTILVARDVAGSSRAVYGILTDDAVSKVRFNGGRIAIPTGLSSSESAPARGAGIVVSQSTDIVPAPPSAMSVRQDKLGTATIVADGQDIYYANFYESYSDASKVRLQVFDLPAAIDQNGLGKPTITYFPIESGFQRIRINGVAGQPSLAGKVLLYRYVELQ